jgi:hypothetical protein
MRSPVTPPAKRPDALPEINSPYNGPYPIPDAEKLCSMSSNLKSCFEGILRTIWIHSDKKYNTAEIKLNFKTLCPSEDSHWTFVLDYNDKRRYGTGPSVSGQFFGVKFHRISVLPVAYALRSDFYADHTNHLRSWVFQGRNKEDEAWTTLDERVKEGGLVKAGSFLLSFVETQQFFTEFRVLQTGPSHTNYLSFNLAGFEIHGRTKRIK